MHTLNYQEVTIMDVKDLIHSVEGNLQQYHTLFSKFAGEMSAKTAMAAPSSQLDDLLSTLVGIQDEVVSFRLKKILHEEHPYLPQIHPDRIRMKSARSFSSPATTAETFLNQRQELLRILHTLSSDNWNRTGVHETEGHISFKEFVRRLVDKDRKVLEQLKILVGSPLQRS